MEHLKDSFISITDKEGRSFKAYVITTSGDEAVALRTSTYTGQHNHCLDDIYKSILNFPKSYDIDMYLLRAFAEEAKRERSKPNFSLEQFLLPFTEASVSKIEKLSMARTRSAPQQMPWSAEEDSDGESEDDGYGYEVSSDEDDYMYLDDTDPPEPLELID